MTGGLVKTYAITGFFFDQQKSCVAFNDGGDGNGGFPEIGHGFFQSPGLRRPRILLPPITGLLPELRARVGMHQRAFAQQSAESVQNAQPGDRYFQIGMIFVDGGLAASKTVRQFDLLISV
jgi:hypothetical protein